MESSKEALNNNPNPNSNPNSKDQTLTEDIDSANPNPNSNPTNSYVSDLHEQQQQQQHHYYLQQYHIAYKHSSTHQAYQPQPYQGNANAIGIEPIHSHNMAHGPPYFHGNHGDGMQMHIGFNEPSFSTTSSTSSTSSYDHNTSDSYNFQQQQLQRQQLEHEQYLQQQYYYYQHQQYLQQQQQQYPSQYPPPTMHYPLPPQYNNSNHLPALVPPSAASDADLFQMRFPQPEGGGVSLAPNNHRNPNLNPNLLNPNFAASPSAYASSIIQQDQEKEQSQQQVENATDTIELPIHNQLSIGLDTGKINCNGQTSMSTSSTLSLLSSPPSPSSSPLSYASSVASSIPSSPQPPSSSSSNPKSAGKNTRQNQNNARANDSGVRISFRTAASKDDSHQSSSPSSPSLPSSPSSFQSPSQSPSSHQQPKFASKVISAGNETSKSVKLSEKGSDGSGCGKTNNKSGVNSNDNNKSVSDNDNSIRVIVSMPSTNPIPFVCIIYDNTASNNALFVERIEKWTDSGVELHTDRESIIEDISPVLAELNITTKGCNSSNFSNINLIKIFSRRYGDSLEDYMSGNDYSFYLNSFRLHGDGSARYFGVNWTCFLLRFARDLINRIVYIGPGVLSYIEDNRRLIDSMASDLGELYSRRVAMVPDFYVDHDLLMRLLLMGGEKGKGRGKGDGGQLRGDKEALGGKEEELSDVLRETSSATFVDIARRYTYSA